MMQTRLFSLFVVITVICIAFAVLLPPHPVAVADGDFQLSISSTTTKPLPANLLVAYCWNELEKDYAETHGTEGNEINFKPITQSQVGVATISLPHSSKYEYDRQVSYHEPKFIVIQFESNGQTQRKSFAVPEGRGDRKLRVDLE